MRWAGSGLALLGMRPGETSAGVPLRTSLEFSGINFPWLNSSRSALGNRPDRHLGARYFLSSGLPLMGLDDLGDGDITVSDIVIDTFQAVSGFEQHPMPDRATSC